MKPQMKPRFRVTLEKLTDGGSVEQFLMAVEFDEESAIWALRDVLNKIAQIAGGAGEEARELD